MSHTSRPPGHARVHPLAGRRIAVTRAREQAGDLVRDLEALGAEVVAAPTIRIARLTDLAALRPATAEALVRRGVVPDLVPDRFVAEAVVSALAAQGEVRGKTVLLPRAREARDALPDGLRALGALVDVIPIYETVRETGDGGG